MDGISKLMYTISMFIITAVSLLLPAFFLTTTTDFYDFNKFALLYVGVIVLIIGSLISLYSKHEITLSSSSVSLPAILFLIATVISVVVNSPNKVESLLSPQGAGGIVLATLWFLLVVGIVKAKEIGWVIHGLIISATVLGLLALLQILGIGFNRFTPEDSFLNFRYWTPAGSMLTLAMFLAAVIPLIAIQLQGAVKEFFSKERSGFPMRLGGYSFSIIIVVLSFLVITSQLLFTARPVLLPLSAGWTVTLESLKNIQRAAFGVGPGNYMFAFTTGKPAVMNLSPVWNVRFLTASNWYMQVIVEIGLIGIATYVMLIIGLVRKTLLYISGLRKKLYRYDPHFLGISVSLLIIILQQFFLPGNFTQLFLFYTLLAMASIMMTSNTFVEKSRVMTIMLSIFGAIFVSFSGYVMYRSYMGEFYMKQSVDASRRNNAQDTYSFQTRALQMNPYIDRYHVVFSQTNLALATALSQKENLSDQEKLDVITLLTQTTNEGKAAVFANPTNVQNWENLARIYKTMVNQVKDADRWALQAYQQSIALDPLNPLLRLETGGVLYSVGRFDLASQVFQETINLKPDWANAYYNLALALKEQKQFQASANAMQAALDRLPKDSPDRERASTELASIKDSIPPAPPAVAGAQTGQDLNSPPRPAGTSPNITLPENASPANLPNPPTTGADAAVPATSPEPGQ